MVLYEHRFVTKFPVEYCSANSTKVYQGTTGQLMRVAIVGSGPSGFYAAQALFDSNVEVDVAMYERLPVPFGLVRYGVAPDHAKIKNVTKVYEKIAAHDRFSFFGNVTVSKEISIAELQTYHDAVILASGAETDKKLGIEGEDLPGSYTATEFVAWYNGHPDYQNGFFDLSGDVAVVVGQGNVATDVCRILCKTADELKSTDITERALGVLAESKIVEVHMIGRRGPVQAAFTPSEIREFGGLDDCTPIIDPEDLSNLRPECQNELGDKQRRQNLEVLEKFSHLNPMQLQKKKRFVMHFLKSPVCLRGDEKVQSVVLEHNVLSGKSGEQKAKGTGEMQELPCGAFFRSVGYRGVPIQGVPFDEQSGTIPNKKGRVLDSGKIVPGLYTVGWIKRGPFGIIGTNKPDSVETVRNLLSDIGDLCPCPVPDDNVLKGLLKDRGVDVIDYKVWQMIDAAEIAKGKALGKPREKFIERGTMLAAVGE